MLLTDNVPGKPRVFLMYIGGFDRYVERCETIVDGVPGRGVAWGWPHAFRRQTGPVMKWREYAEELLAA